MTKKFFAFAAVSAFLLGCADIPDELRDQAEGKCNGRSYTEYQFCANGIVYDFCDGTPYNPSIVACCNNHQYTKETEFCSQSNIYRKCGGREYDLETQFCSGSDVLSKCGGSIYSPATQFCYNNTSYSLCGDSKLSYNPDTQVCQSGVVQSKCGNSWYNVSTQFCSGSSVYSKCNGSTYDPSNQRCQSGAVETKCGTGSSYYNPSTQFCSGSSVYSKCNGSTYDPSNQRCQSDAVETKCETSYYNPLVQFCTSDGVYSLCGGKTYEPYNQRCQSDVVETWCGGKWYALTSNQFCQSGVVQTNCGSGYYDASNTDFRCQSNVVETKCGSDWYNPKTQFCQSPDVVKPLCGTETYTSTQFCQSPDVVKPLCGAETYTSAKYCSKGTLKNYGSITYKGKTYKTIEIGDQTWMAENLNLNVDGSKCGDSDDRSLSDANTWVCDTYGRLYDWATAMDLPGCGYGFSCASQIGAKHQGICPSGWHIPSADDWDALINATIRWGGSAEGIKAISGWYGNNKSGTDEFGFSALPGGYGYGPDSYDSYRGRYSSGYWWGATENNAHCAYYIYIDDITRNIQSNYYSCSNGLNKDDLFSVRCLKD